MTGVATGSAVVISYSTGCGSNATLSVSILASPNVITGTTHVCSGSTSTLSSTTTAGTWSSSNTSVASVNSSTGVVTGVGQGIAQISYTKTGCARVIFDTVKTTPSSISGASSICSGTTTALTNTSLYGTWSSSNTGVATIDATGTASGVANGSATITYSTGCGSNATKSESVITTPAVITGTTGICQAATSTLHDATGSGSWSSSNTSVATVNGSGVLGGVAQGTATITYNISGCFTTTTATITGIPTAITGTTAICNGSTSALADAIASGTWTSSDATIATVDATGFVTSVAVGTANITYSTGCGSDAVAAISIDVAPTTITGATTLCTTGNTSLSADVASGSWSSSSTSVATVNASTGAVYGVGEGTANISYSLTNGCGTTVLSSPMAVSQTGKWNGSSSTDWNDAGNWPCGTIPDATIDVVIPAGTTFLPDFSAATFAVKSFTVASGAHISIGGDALIDVKGNFTNNGLVDGDGYVNLSGSSAQTVYGKGTISNLTVNNTHGASINSTDSVYVSGDLTLTAGTLTTNGGVVLVNNSLSTGRIAPITGGAISGNVTAQQYFQGGRRAFRFFGHPFNSAIALSQLENYIDITGAGGSTNGFTATGSNAPSCFWYHTTIGNSAQAYDQGWEPFTATNTVVDTNKFKQYEGVRLFIRGAKGEGLGYNSYTPSAVTINMYGQVNTGNLSITMHKGAHSDYNQLSNPYPSPTDIGTVIYNEKTAGHVTGAAFYVWNPFLGSAGAFEPKPITNAAYILDENSSFQVRAASEGATLSFTESNKAQNADETLLRSANVAPQYIALHVYDGANHPWDMTYISFNNEASSKEEGSNDATKAMNPDLNFYSLSSDNSKLSIDARPYTNSTIIPLGFTTNYAQQYTIKAENVVLPEGGHLFLHDKYMATYTAMEQGAEYKFAITADAATQGENRFELTTTQPTAAVENSNLSLSMSPNPATSEVNITFNSNNTASTTINIMNAAGVSVMNKDLGTQQAGKVSISLNELSAGIYIVEITNGDQKKVAKLVKE